MVSGMHSNNCPKKKKKKQSAPSRENIPFMGRVEHSSKLSLNCCATLKLLRPLYKFDHERSLTVFKGIRGRNLAYLRLWFKLLSNG